MNTRSVFPAMLFVATLFALISFAYAQISPGSFVETLTLSASPQMPGANEEVHVTAQSFSIDLDRADIAWRVNGQIRASGPGMTEITVQTGAFGETTQITAAAVSPEGSGTAALTLRPVRVDVLWEANTYTPPFYRGRALPSDGASVRAAALAHFVRPNGVRVPESDIIYTWKVNGRVVGSASGRGRSSATLPGPGLFGEMVITVEAESVDYAYRGEGISVVPGSEPYLVLYPDYPAGGTAYHTALTGSADISDSEFTVTAVPYFASATSPRDPSLRYRWSVNGSSVPAEPADPSRLTFGLEGGESGVARVRLQLDHLRHLLQSADRSWMLRFGSLSAPANPFQRSVDLE